eukprot:scaffold3450_cov114-Cylindrotheca_fusiformis.AAC.11
MENRKTLTHQPGRKIRKMQNQREMMEYGPCSYGIAFDMGFSIDQRTQLPVVRLDSTSNRDSERKPKLPGWGSAPYVQQIEEHVRKYLQPTMDTGANQSLFKSRLLEIFGANGPQDST